MLPGRATLSRPHSAFTCRRTVRICQGGKDRKHTPDRAFGQGGESQAQTGDDRRCSPLRDHPFPDGPAGACRPQRQRASLEGLCPTAPKKSSAGRQNESGENARHSGKRVVPHSSMSQGTHRWLQRRRAGEQSTRSRRAQDEMRAIIQKSSGGSSGIPAHRGEAESTGPPQTSHGPPGHSGLPTASRCGSCRAPEKLWQCYRQDKSRSQVGTASAGPWVRQFQAPHCALLSHHYYLYLCLDVNYYHRVQPESRGRAVCRVARPSYMAWQRQL